MVDAPIYTHELFFMCEQHLWNHLLPKGAPLQTCHPLKGWKRGNECGWTKAVENEYGYRIKYLPELHQFGLFKKAD